VPLESDRVHPEPKFVSCLTKKTGSRKGLGKREKISDELTDIANCSGGGSLGDRSWGPRPCPWKKKMRRGHSADNDF